MSEEFANCASMTLRRAARQISQFYDRKLQQGGLRNTQFSLLVMLRYLEPVSISELAEHLGMDRSTLTRNAKLLAQNALIEERPSEDGRVRLLALTEDGQSAVDELAPMWREAQQDFLARFGADRWERLRAELRAVEELISKS